MPARHKAQLVESATPLQEVWAIMAEALKPQARAILAKLGYYAARDLEIPGSERDGELTEGEEEELKPVLRALVEAAMLSESMPERILLATLQKVAKDPSRYFSGTLPADVLWVIAGNYQRGEEKPGTFAMDVWGGEQISCHYPLETPSEASVKQAARTAMRRIDEACSLGRPNNSANRLIAEQMGNIFRSTGRPIVRRRKSSKMYKGEVVYVEVGQFKEFLELVLPPLQQYLREHNLAPVTIDSVVRFASKRPSSVK
ncbi:hypothetical protein ACVI1L_005966 [Bradyrhizobium sp. USDA 4516]